MASAHHEPGRDWLDVIGRQAVDAFAIALVPQPVLEALVALKPIIGVEGVRAFFQATGQMYRRLAVTQDGGAERRAPFQWNGDVRGGGQTRVLPGPTDAVRRIAPARRPLTAAGLRPPQTAAWMPTNDNHAH